MSEKEVDRLSIIKKCLLQLFMERFWRSLKQKNVYPNSYKTLMEAKRGIDNYQRLHSSIGYKTPMELYKQELKKAA